MCYMDTICLINCWRKEEMNETHEFERPDPRAGGCIAALILIPLQIIYSIITIPVMLIVAIIAGIAKLFGGGDND